jgi:hypothetical protein
MLTYSGRHVEETGLQGPTHPRGNMRFFSMCVVAAALGAAIPVACADLALAQSTDAKPAEKQALPPAEGKEKKVDEFAEAEKVLGGPAANPECVWLGRRVVSLLWRDDLDTAFRHLDLYDRFGCPGGHIQATFRCLVRQGHIDPKATDTINSRVHSCWINPDIEAKGTAAATNGTTNR